MATIISKPNLKLINNSLYINYDFMDADPQERYNVWIDITDSTGVKFRPYSLAGDIGDSIKAGKNKQIVWHLTADKVFLRGNINVIVYAEKVIGPRYKESPETIPTREKKKEHTAVKETDKRIFKAKSSMYIVQSVVFPGWGLTKLYDGKPYWLIGVGTVGCVAGSIYLNKKATDNYNDYKNAGSGEDYDHYFNTAKKQDKISEALAWSAALIWIADLGYTYIKAKKEKQSGALSMGTGLEPNTGTNVISISYKF